MFLSFVCENLGQFKRAADDQKTGNLCGCQGTPDRIIFFAAIKMGCAGKLSR
jgi:hypothetical protein